MEVQGATAAVRDDTLKVPTVQPTEVTEEQYTLQCPDLPFDPAYKRLLQEWYARVDAMVPDEELAALFTEDGVFAFGVPKFTGHAEIMNLLAGTRVKVSARSHRNIKIFPYGPNADSLAMTGTVDYHLKAGGTVTVDWSGYMELVKCQGQPKIKFYQIYLATYDL